jgi:hypothetical protein
MQSSTCQEPVDQARLARLRRSYALCGAQCLTVRITLAEEACGVRPESALEESQQPREAMRIVPAESETPPAALRFTPDSLSRGCVVRRALGS